MTAATPVTAGSLAPATSVVPAAEHRSIVTQLKIDLANAEADLTDAWRSHQVYFIAALSLFAGVLFARVL